MGRGWPFYFFPGVLQGSFSLPGVDVFLFRGGLFSFSWVDFFSLAGVDFFPFQGGLFSFAGVDFFPLQEWTFFLFRGGLFPLQGGLFSSAGWPFLEERIRCRELPDYSVL